MRYTDRIVVEDTFPRIRSDSYPRLCKNPQEVGDLPIIYDRNDFVTQKVENLRTADKIYDDRSSQQISTSIFKPFKNNRGWYLVTVTPFELGLKKLTGCISVVIVGDGGIYAAHFFEDLSLDPATDDYPPKLLREGNKKFPRLSNFIDALGCSPLNRRGKFPEVYIINPVKSAAGPPITPVDHLHHRIDTRSSDEQGYILNKREHARQYKDIVCEIQSHWPAINTIHEVRYKARNLQNAGDKFRINNTPEGRIYFEYFGKRGGLFKIRLHIEGEEKIHWSLPWHPELSFPAAWKRNVPIISWNLELGKFNIFFYRVGLQRKDKGW